MAGMTAFHHENTKVRKREKINAKTLIPTNLFLRFENNISGN